ncbi:MAG: hypothetical protein HC809_06900 [Gammaproteobacteria bacterium]|nr:hypothetical protein [Gammaproteobacteria bacterium]
MPVDRKTDTQSKTRFRSDRFFVSQGQWFCSTRDGETPLGPFAERALAEAALRNFLIENGIDPAQDPWGQPGVSN